MPLNIAPLPKALHTLRQAAIERIRFFQEALGRFGLRPRMGAELEFFPLSKAGLAQPHLLDARYLTRELESVPTVEKIYREMDIHDAQYELVTGIGRRFKDEGINIAGPLHAAETVAAFKSGMRAKTPEWGLGGVTFAARVRSGSILENSGLHINTSLWDKAGKKNLFYRFGHATTDLERHVADAMIETHATTGAAYFPRSESFERIAASAISRGTMQGANDLSSGVPTRAGIMFNKGMTLGNAWKIAKGLWKKEPEVASVAARHRSVLNMPLGLVIQPFAGRTVMIGWERPHQYRLESRLAGADADPYVVVAAELASVYDAVRKNTIVPNLRHMLTPKGYTGVDVGGRKLMVKHHDGKFASHRLALDATTAHHAMLTNDRMRNLLGEDLYHGIVAVTAPKEAELAQAAKESIGHFQRLVRVGRGEPHDRTGITTALHDALAEIPATKRVKHKGNWSRRTDEAQLPTGQIEY